MPPEILVIYEIQHPGVMHWHRKVAGNWTTAGSLRSGAPAHLTFMSSGATAAQPGRMRWHRCFISFSAASLPLSKAIHTGSSGGPPCPIIDPWVRAQCLTERLVDCLIIHQ